MCKNVSPAGNRNPWPAISALFDTPIYVADAYHPATSTTKPSANPDQKDGNQDGIGDLCTCGDADGNGVLQAGDAFQIALCVSTPANCTADVNVADTDNNGVLQAADAFNVASHVTDPTLPQQDLVCAGGRAGPRP